MNRPLKITPAQAGRLMGKSALFIREGLKRGELEIGTAMQMPGSTRWSFHISPKLLSNYLGVTVADLTTMVEEDANAAV